MVDERPQPPAGYNTSQAFRLRSGHTDETDISRTGLPKENVGDRSSFSSLMCMGNGGIAGACSSTGSGHEDALEEKCELPGTEQSERVMEQMRRCVLIHHQLSCLLIHNAALRAGLYTGDDAKLPTVTPEGNTRYDDLAASIHDLGGSTSRLFSLALRDRNDLESMEHTLRGKVEEMVEMMRSEYESAKCNAEMSPLTTTQILAMSKSLQMEAANLPVEDRIGSEQCLVNNDVDAAKHECQQLSAELVRRRLHVAELREELEGIREADRNHQTQVTNASFDKVQRAMDRNAELAEVLAQLLAVPTMQELLPGNGACTPPAGYPKRGNHTLMTRHLEEESAIDTNADNPGSSFSEPWVSYPNSARYANDPARHGDDHTLPLQPLRGVQPCRDDFTKISPTSMHAMPNSENARAREAVRHESLEEWSDRVRSSQSQFWSL